MSLLVWLPLINDNHNQGLLNLTPTVLGTVSYINSGKIGKCLSAGDGTSSTGINGLSYNSNLVEELGTEFSCAVWVKPLGNHLHYEGAIISSGDWNSNCWAFGLNQNNTAVDVFSKNYNRNISCSVPINQWTHLCCTSDNGVVKLYKNGEYIGSTTQSATLASDATNFTVGRETYASGYFSFNGNLNDLRIYNHVLSLKEIKELAKGLVCHYPLNGGGRGGDNLYTEPYWKYSTTKWGYAAQVGTVKPVLNSDGSVTFTGGGGTNSQCYIHHISNRVAISSNTTYTVSCKVTASGSGTFKIYLYQYDSSGTRVGNTMTTIHNFVDGETKTISNTITTTSTTASFYTELNMYASPTTSTMLLHANSLKLEKGNKVTPWMPNSADTQYSAMGYDSTTEYDVSGYGNNGTKNGLTYSSDTPRYSVSTIFDANTDNITPSSFYSLEQTIDEMSVSIWFKTNTLNSTQPNLWSLGENSFVRMRLASATSLWYYVKVGNLIGNTATYTTKTLTDNTWHHAVYTFKAGIVTVYLDGVQVGTTNHSSSGKYMTCSNISWHIGGYSGYAEKFIGSLSDFRIYATALSATQVAELYNTAVSVANNGTLMGYELVEV